MKINIIYFLIVFVVVSVNAQEIEKLEQEQLWIFGGEIYRVDNFPSVYVANRTVDIWVPENYSSDKKYSVIYMHDGGALFGKKTNKKEWGSKWKADEVATKLLNENKVKEFINVGIYNTGKTRWNEYFPSKSINYLDKNYKDSLFFENKNQHNHTNLIADNYLKFIVKELKPYIDITFSVYKNAKNTYIAGSSMGGLISMYAIFEYPKIFSRAACISTHWMGVAPNKDGVYDKRVPLSIFDYMKDHVPNPNNHRLWFDYGNAVGDLDSYYVDYAVHVDSIFNNKGYDSKNFKNILFNGEKHSGKSWNKRLDQIFEFLLKE